MVTEHHTFKIFPSLLHGCHTPQLQNIAIPVMVFSTHNFKVLPILHMEFFWIGNPTLFFFFFLEIGRKYVSIIITIVRNITVLVSYNIYLVWIFMPVSHGVNKYSSQVPPTTSLPTKVCTRFVCCFTKNTLSTLFYSDQIICQT